MTTNYEPAWREVRIMAKPANLVSTSKALTAHFYYFKFIFNEAKNFLITSPRLDISNENKLHIIYETVQMIGNTPFAIRAGAAKMDAIKFPEYFMLDEQGVVKPIDKEFINSIREL